MGRKQLDGAVESAAEKATDSVELSVLDQLIEEYTPEEQVFEVVVPSKNGEEGKAVLKFRVFDHEGSQAFRDAAASWWNMVRKASPTNLKKMRLEGLVPKDVRSAMTAFTIHYHSVEPRISIERAMRMLNAPSLCDYLTKQIDVHSKTVLSNIEAQAIEKLKNGSGATIGEE